MTVLVLVLVEPDGDGVSPASLAAVGFAQDLPGASGVDAAGVDAAGVDAAGVEAVGVGRVGPGAVADRGAAGVPVLPHARDARLADFAAAAWATAVCDRAAALAPAAVLAPATSRGTQVLAHVAARLERPMAAGCVHARREPGTGALVVRRQVMGGAALEEVELSGAPVLLTVAAHDDPAPSRPAPVVPQVREFSPAITDADLLTRVRRVERATDAGADLATARVVVGGGRGVGGAERFADLEELAGRLGGVVGVSRVVTSLGWRPHAEQIGQTGTRISPDVYIACGISGAIQHWAGCAGARTVIAVNTDAAAPMVTRADYAVIGDLHEVLRAVNAELAARAAHPDRRPPPR